MVIIGLFKLKSNGGWENLGTFTDDVLKLPVSFTNVKDKSGDLMSDCFFTDASISQLKPFKIDWKKVER